MPVDIGKYRKPLRSSWEFVNPWDTRRNPELHWHLFREWDNRIAAGIAVFCFAVIGVRWMAAHVWHIALHGPLGTLWR